MRLPRFLTSTALIATAILGVSSSVYGQSYNSNPNWQGNQNSNWQGNQTPDYRNDNGWNASPNNNNQQQSYYQGQNSGSNYYSRGTNANDPAPSYSNPSSMFDENDKLPENKAGAAYFNNSGNGKDPSQGYYYRNQNDNQSGDPQNENKGGSAQNGGPDSLVQHRVEEALKNNYLRKNYEQVVARVYNGTVTLSGTVGSDEERDDVEARARNIPGIINVNDQIKVTAPAKTAFIKGKNRSFIADNNSDDSTTQTPDDKSDSSDSKPQQRASLTNPPNIR
jgi:osmotically-inducible protein OsmY